MLYYITQAFLFSRGSYYSPRSPMVWQIVKSSFIWKPAMLTWTRKDSPWAPWIWYHVFSLKLYVNKDVLFKYSASSSWNRCSGFSLFSSVNSFVLGDMLPKPVVSCCADLWTAIKHFLTFPNPRWLEGRSVQTLTSRLDCVGMCPTAFHQFSFLFLGSTEVFTAEQFCIYWILCSNLHVEIWPPSGTEKSILCAFIYLLLMFSCLCFPFFVGYLSFLFP